MTTLIDRLSKVSGIEVIDLWFVQSMDSLGFSAVVQDWSINDFVYDFDGCVLSGYIGLYHAVVGSPRSGVSIDIQIYRRKRNEVEIESL